MLKCVFICAVTVIWAVAHSACAQLSTPLEIADLVLWTDGKDISGTGTQPSAGSLVTTWADKSGQGNDLTAVTATAPTFEDTGFDGVHPGLRFTAGKFMAGPNVFPANTDNAQTIFFINANVTLTANISVSLNGTNTGRNIADGRYLFHTPWITNTAFYDAGACCGATRLSGPFPNSLTETTLYSALNDEVGNQQLFRIDGTLLDSDATGHNANVSRGIRIGTTLNNYNGRFAEILIYDRALTIAEIEDVECFLLLKWKPTAAPTGCVNEMTGTKTVADYDPLASGVYNLPGKEVIYTISISHENGPPLNEDSVFLTDALPAEVIYYNGGTDPVTFTAGDSGLNFTTATDLGFSNISAAPANFAACNYTPTEVYDENVRHLCFAPKGIFNSAAIAPSFNVQFRARIK